MPHIYNLGVTDVLKALTAQPFRDAIAAIETDLTPEQLDDPVVALRGLIAAVCSVLNRLLIEIIIIFQLRMSPQRREAFREIQGSIFKLAKGKDGKYIGTYELLLDVVTRWSSTYFMLERACKLCKVSRYFLFHYIAFNSQIGPRCYGPALGLFCCVEEVRN